MPKLNSKYISVLAFSLFAQGGVANAQMIVKEQKLSPPQISQYIEANGSQQDQSPKKLDKFIKKMFLTAVDVLAARGYDEALGDLPTHGVYIETADENKTGTTPPAAAAAPVVAPPAAAATAAKPAIVMDEPPAVTPEGGDAATNQPLLAPVSVNDSDEKNENDNGLIGKMLKKGPDEPEKNKAEDSISPLYWENVREEYERKREERLKKQEEEKSEGKEAQISVEDDKGTKVLKAGEGENILLKRRPVGNYRNQRLPSSISKQEYTKENAHLPIAQYEEGYKKILFDSVLSQNIDVMRAMIKRLGSTEIRDKDGNTPLLYAVMAGNMTVTRILVGMGAAIDTTNFYGSSPLYVAIKSNRDDLVQFLVARGGNAGIVAGNGKDLLMLAAEDNNAKMTSLLVNKGVNLNNKMQDGNTALHFAAIKNSYPVAAMLIENGAQFNVRNHDGYTPLMIASAYGSEDMVDLLLHVGADITTSDALGQDAYALASLNWHPGIIAMLASAKFRLSEKDKGMAKVYASPIDESLAKMPMPVKKPDAVNSSDNSGNFAPPEIKSSNPKKPTNLPKPMFSSEEKAKM